MANRLRDQAAGLGIADRVEFPGEVSSQTMAGLYARAQVVAFPVLRHEPFGLVGVESLAYAKPIVAFAGGAVEEWLWPDETGVRVDERTPDAFASAMDLLLSNPSRCAGMGRAARARYGFFTPAKYVERLVEAYERCIAWHRESAGSAL
jgi:glycosyltransferase involved in cell wall biosynthesis